MHRHFGAICLFAMCMAFPDSVKTQDLKQRTLDRFQFEEYKIASGSDTIYVYLHQKKGSAPEHLVIFLQGTSPIPQSFFSVEEKNGGYAYVQYFSPDYEQLTDKYAYAIIGLPGVPVVEGGQGAADLHAYNQKNSLDYRVFCADVALDYISDKLFRPGKVIVYGHSEGAPVAAKLATVNKRITHLGFWGGNALPDFYDFILFDRKENLAGRQSDTVTQQNIDRYIELFRQIAKDSSNTLPAMTSEVTEYTNKRWWSYAEPPIHHLLKIDIPVFVQAATEDESAPVESNYLIPLEFIRLGKANLTFKVCIGCDHGFVHLESGRDLWTDVFVDFMAWTEHN